MAKLPSFIFILLLAFTIHIINGAVIPKDQADGKKPVQDDSKDFLHRFMQGFIASIYVIIISELGDKTFFIAAIMSIDHSRKIVYAGAMSALITMTVLSALVGYATEVLPRIYTYYLSGILFLLFGLKMIKDACYMKPEDSREEYKEVEEQLSGSNTSGSRLRAVLRGLLSPIFAEALVMTFLAEWGDRSQITTIVLAAREDVLGVIVGGSLGHALCTGLAVLAGRIVAQRIPVKWLTYLGGATFLLFGIATFVTRPDVS
nr:transmembrane protein 165 [Hymenolepis microstoma]